MMIIRNRISQILSLLVCMAVILSACSPAQKTVAPVSPQALGTPGGKPPSPTSTVLPSATAGKISQNQLVQTLAQVTPDMTATPLASPTAPAGPSADVSPTVPTPTATQPSMPGMRLVFNESFTGQNLNADVWNTQYRWGSTNPPELEEYSPQALSIQNGGLQITASKSNNPEHPYTSGMIASYDRFYFQYGYVEIRAKMPKGQGVWPALWMLAQDPKYADEIDIIEVLGNQPDKGYASIHYKNADGTRGHFSADVNGPDFSQDFHTFAIQWDYDKVVWYVDGQEVARTTDHVPHEPMYLLANLAVGGVWPGYPNKDTVFPASFDISYIRVFTK